MLLSWRFSLDAPLLIIRKLILVGHPSIPFFAWCLVLNCHIWPNTYLSKNMIYPFQEKTSTKFFMPTIFFILFYHRHNFITTFLWNCIQVFTWCKRSYFINYNKVHIIPEIVIWSLLNEFLDCHNNTFRCWDTKHIFYYDCVRMVLEVSLLSGIFRWTNAWTYLQFTL